jgi:hypothetical protein
VHPNCDFGYKEINRPIIKTVSVGSKRLPYAFINSIPQGFKFNISIDSLNQKLRARQTVLSFTIQSMDTLAGFNTNDFKANYDTFNQNCISVMFS